MIEGWDKLSPSERQDVFLTKWAAGEGIEFPNDQAKAGYQYRAGIIKDAIQLKKTPDRVPVFPLTTFAPASLYGRTAKELMYDGDLLGKTYVDFTIEYDADAAGAVPMVMYGPALETLGYELYKWPGHGVKDELPYQFCEKDYMKAEDYDQLINDPSDFWLRTWIPRTHAALGPMSAMPPVYGTMELPMAGPWLATLGAPPIQEAFKALLKAGEQCFQWINTLLPYMGQILASGYPFYAGGATKAPFDLISDTFRGTSQLMMDLYRRPEKVLEALDRMVPLMVSAGVGGAVANNNPIVFIPLHKGADGFMSNDQFGKFYWPTLKATMEGIAAAGCIPCCFVEGGYNDRLEFLADFPKGQALYIFDRTDMAKARKVLGGHSCIGGGFPVSLILTGTVPQVVDGTKKLLDDAAGDGGFILSIGCAMDEGKEDTLKAFIKTGQEYGKY